MLPGVKYWRGITDALAEKGVEVITAEVSPSARIEVRAATLAESIERKAKGKAVNIIAQVNHTLVIQAFANHFSGTAWLAAISRDQSSILLTVCRGMDCLS